MSILGQIVIVTIKDGRKFYGRLVGVDKNKTILLDRALEEIPKGQESGVNKQLMTFSSYSTQAQDEDVAKEYIDTAHFSSEEQCREFCLKFMSNKIRHTAVVIHGESILKVERQVVQSKALN